MTAPGEVFDTSRMLVNSGCSETKTGRLILGMSCDRVADCPDARRAVLSGLATQEPTPSCGTPRGADASGAWPMKAADLYD